MVPVLPQIGQKLARLRLGQFYEALNLSCHFRTSQYSAARVYYNSLFHGASPSNCQISPFKPSQASLPVEFHSCAARLR